MKIKEFAYVCYAVTDLKRARDFYEKVLGLKVGQEWLNGAGGFIEYECGPDTLAIGAGAPGFNPGPNGATTALELEDFEESVAMLKKANVKFLVEPMETPVCSMAIFSDPDGNNLMIHKRK
jgi:predicted enzyme related to lactoylglutathione lyase